MEFGVAERGEKCDTEGGDTLAKTECHIEGGKVGASGEVHVKAALRDPAQFNLKVENFHD